MGAVASVAGEGGFDVGPFALQGGKNVQANRGPCVFARSVVFIDDDVVNAEGIEGCLQGRPRQCEEWAHDADAGAQGHDDVRCASAAASTLTRQVQKQPFGDVAALVGGDDDTHGPTVSDLGKARVAGTSQSLFVAGGWRDDDDLVRQTQALGTQSHRGRGCCRNRLPWVIHADDDDSSATRAQAPGPAGESL